MRASHLLVALALASTWPVLASAQYADQKALEAALRALHTDSDVELIVSPILVAPNIEGSVRIDEENRAALESHLDAEIVELETAVSCADLREPESCTTLNGATIYQFFMPEPLRDGVLQLAVMLLKDGAGEGGQIRREWWNLALVRQPDVGWTVVEQQLQNTADGPW